MLCFVGKEGEGRGRSRVWYYMTGLDWLTMMIGLLGMLQE